MSINWNFGDQRAIETKSTFTKDADAAFDEFCKTYLNSSNGFFMSSPITTHSTTSSKTFTSDTANKFSNLDTFLSSLANNTNTSNINNNNNTNYDNINMNSRSYNSSNKTYFFDQSLQDLSSLTSQKSKSAKNSISFRDSLSYFKEDALFKSQLSLEQQHKHNEDTGKKSIDNLININEAINKLSIDTSAITSASTTSINSNNNGSNSKTPENVLINLRLKNSRNRPKRRSIENLMETFEEFNKANKYSQQHPTLIEETNVNTSASSNHKSLRKHLNNDYDKSTVSTSSIRDKDTLYKSSKLKTSSDRTNNNPSTTNSNNNSNGKSDNRPKSFYGYPNNFYIEKYLESSYKTIDIIDHLNDFNKNYDRISKEKNKNLESDFSAINNYEELKVNDEYTTPTSTNILTNTSNDNNTNNDDEVKSKVLNNSELLNQLNNINQLQQERLNQSNTTINISNTNTSVNTSNNLNLNDELNSINNGNLLENEVNNLTNILNENNQSNVQMDSFTSYLKDSGVYIVDSSNSSNKQTDSDYNRGSFHEASATCTIDQLIQTNHESTNDREYNFAGEFKSSESSSRYQKPSCLIESNYDQLVLDIPKKKSFIDEFYKPKNQTNRSQPLFGHAISFNFSTFVTDDNGGTTTTNNASEINTKENDSFINDYISSYIAVPSNLKLDKPKDWLGFKVIACGLKKNGELPVPKPNYFVDRGDFGDDAGFYSENVYGDAIGVADGATGNCMLGYDPGDFSRNLMQLCSEIFVRENKMYDAKTLLLKAYDIVQDKTCYGSCTACVITLSHHNNIMTAANVGDTGYCVLRNNKIIHKSIPQRISYECPRQLDSYPWKEKSRKMGVSYTEILGNDTICETFKVQKDDIIIVSSDGLYDNLEFDEIERIYSKSKNDYDAIKNLVFNSVKFYRKPDDILVLIAKVVDNKPACIQQKFTKDPYASL